MISEYATGLKLFLRTVPLHVITVLLFASSLARVAGVGLVLLQSGFGTFYHTQIVSVLYRLHSFHCRLSDRSCCTNAPMDQSYADLYTFRHKILHFLKTPRVDKCELVLNIYCACTVYITEPLVFLRMWGKNCVFI